MISYEVYKILHLVGLTLVFMGLAGVLFAHMLNANVKGQAKILGFVMHGVGILIMLVSGFGLAARLGMVSGLPTWVYAKLAIWVFLGIAISLVKRMPKLAPVWVTLFTILVAVAAWLAITKPMF